VEQVFAGAPQQINPQGHVEPTARLRDDGERRPGELRRGGRMAGPHRRLRRVRQADRPREVDQRPQTSTNKILLENLPV